MGRDSRIVLQIVALMIIFLDHPLRDAYLLSLAAILPVLTLAVLAIWENHPLGGKMINIAISVLAVIGVITTSYQSILAKQDEVAEFSASQTQARESISNYALATGRASQDLMVFWMYGTYSNCWGLRTGNSHTQNIFEKEVNAIRPNRYELGNNEGRRPG